MADALGLWVVLVEPQTPGNIGTAARAIKNFGLSGLVLVDPPTAEPTGEARAFAGQARDDVLPAAQTASFESVLERFHTIGTTATVTSGGDGHVRFPPTTPTGVRDALGSVAGEVALVFGRERDGLTNAELAQMDEVCTIPADPTYPVLNLGQAVTVMAYALSPLLRETAHTDASPSTLAEPAATEQLYRYLRELLELVEPKAHKRAKSGRMLRRVLGRAHLTAGEVATLTGVVRRSITAIRD
ncbi:MAG: RNA methyltransferase [Haloquadratum sp.]|nr:RNA methyltransferase [Haloferacaceae archaeon]MDR9445119.1 RNA methyltransferase [Haloquadratum sp.]